MKSAAIVLGLALAVNAQVDNELATSFPSHPSGADLVRNAGWGRSQPIHVPPKHTNPVYWSKNDDAADDEFAYLSGADLVKYAKESQQTVYRPTAHVVRRDDEVDDELMVYYTKDSQGNKHYQGGYTVRRDDAADDELVQTFYSPSGADLVKYAKQSQQTVYRPTAHVVRDDEVDDELMVYYTKDSQGNKHYQGGYTVRRDDAADDELVQTFYSPSGADLVKYAKQSQQTVYRPTAHVVSRDDEVDDELMVYYTKDSQGNRHYEGGYTVRRDDEADDELVSLGHLIKEAEQVEKKGDVRKYFRHL
jgi:hypothetical protein